MRGADLWPSRGDRRRRLAVGCLFVVLILGGLVWAITSLPDNRRAPPRQLPTPPPPVGFSAPQEVWESGRT